MTVGAKEKSSSWLEELWARVRFSTTGRLAPLLAVHFEVITFDRRGRGDSGDKRPHAVKREVEDIKALIDSAGGAASLFGISSGAALVFETAIALPGMVQRFAMCEVPYDAAAAESSIAYGRRLRELLAEGRPGDAVELFMALVGVPAEQLEAMRTTPLWAFLEAVVPTLACDQAVLGDDHAPPLARAAGVVTPALVMAGGAGAPFMRTTARALVDAMPHARYKLLEGQRHDVAAEALAPLLVEFFRSGPLRAASTAA